MSLRSHLRRVWKDPTESLDSLWKERLIQWRKDPATLRLERPTRLDRAHALGYKAKNGILVVRQRVLRGGHVRTRPGGRKAKRMSVKRILHKGYQQIAEERAAKSFKNCEVLNSYWVAQDGQHYWFEIILVDRAHPEVIADKNLSWVKTTRGRIYRGLTSSAKGTRGLSRKGKGAEHIRPSRRANLRKK